MFDFLRPKKLKGSQAGAGAEPAWVSPAWNPPLEPMLALLKQYKAEDFTAPPAIGGGQRTESGAIQMPYTIDTPAQAAFRSVSCEWERYGFDYPAWNNTPQGQRMMAGEEGSIENASKEDIGALLTSMLRGDRFCDGAFAGLCTSGSAWRIMKRVEVLYREQQADTEKSKQPMDPEK